MALITISTAVINYPAGTTDCQLSVAVDVPTVGQTYVGRTVSLSSADLAPDWTDAQLCEAIAAKLGVPAADVSVADAPEGKVATAVRASIPEAINAIATVTTDEGAES